MTSHKLILAQVLSIRDPHVYYHACKKCYSKVMLNNNSYVCLKCDKTVEPRETQQRYRLSVNITDGGVKCSVTIFGQQLDSFMGCSANEFDRILCGTSGRQVTSILEESLNKSFCGKWFLFGFKNFSVKKCNTRSVSLKDIVPEHYDGSPIVAWQMAVCEDKTDTRNTVIEYLCKYSTLPDGQNLSSYECESPSFSFEQNSVSGMHSLVDNSEIGGSGIEITLNQEMLTSAYSSLSCLQEVPTDFMNSIECGSSESKNNCIASDEVFITSMECVREETIDSMKSYNLSTMDCDDTYDPALHSCAMSIHSLNLTSLHRRGIKICALTENQQVDKITDASSMLHEEESFKEDSSSKTRSHLSEVSTLNASEEEDTTMEDSLLLLAGGSLVQSLQHSNIGTSSLVNVSRCNKHELYRCRNEVLATPKAMPQLVHESSVLSVKGSQMVEDMPYSEDLEVFLESIEQSDNCLKSMQGTYTGTSSSGNVSQWGKHPLSRCRDEVNATPKDMTEAAHAFSVKGGQLVDDIPYSEDIEAFLADMQECENCLKSFSEVISEQSASSNKVANLGESLKNCNTEIVRSTNNKFDMSTSVVSVVSDIEKEMPYSEDLNAFLNDIDNSFSYMKEKSVTMDANIKPCKVSICNATNNSEDVILKHLPIASVADTETCTKMDTSQRTDCDKTDTSQQVEVIKRHDVLHSTDLNQNKHSSSSEEELPYSEDLEAFLADMDTSLKETKARSSYKSLNDGSISTTTISANTISVSNRSVPALSSQFSLNEANMLSGVSQNIDNFTDSIESQLKGMNANLHISELVQSGQEDHSLVVKVIDSKVETKTGKHEPESTVTDPRVKTGIKDCNSLLTNDDGISSSQRYNSVSVDVNSYSEDMFADRSLDCNDNGIIPITPRIKKGKSFNKYTECPTRGMYEEAVHDKSKQPVTVSIHPSDPSLLGDEQRKRRRKSVNFAMHLLQTRAIPKIDVQMLHTPSPSVCLGSKIKSCLKKHDSARQRPAKLIKGTVTTVADSEEMFTPSPLAVSVTKHATLYQRPVMLTKETVTNVADSEEMFTPSPLGVSVSKHVTLYQSTPNLFDDSASICELTEVSSGKENCLLLVVENDPNMSSQLFTDESGCDVSSFTGGITLSLKQKTLKAVGKPKQYILSDISNSSSQFISSKYWDSNVSEDLFSDEESFGQKENICLKLFPE